MRAIDVVINQPGGLHSSPSSSFLDFPYIHSTCISLALRRLHVNTMTHLLLSNCSSLSSADVSRIGNANLSWMFLALKIIFALAMTYISKGRRKKKGRSAALNVYWTVRGLASTWPQDVLLICWCLFLSFCPSLRVQWKCALLYFSQLIVEMKVK